MGKIKDTVLAEELLEDKVIQYLRDFSIDNDHTRPIYYQRSVAKNLIEYIKREITNDVIE